MSKLHTTVALLLVVGICLGGPSSAQARDLQQADAAASVEPTTTPPAPESSAQATSASSRSAPNLFTSVPSAAAASATVDARNLPKEVEVVTTQTASGQQPVSSMVKVNTQLITSATRRLRLQLPGGATITAVRRPDLDKVASLSLATPAGTSTPAGSAAAAAAGAPGVPIIWVGEVVGQRLGLSSVTLVVGENGGVYGNIRYLDRKTNTIQTFRIDPSLKDGADPTASAASAASTTADGISMAALYPAADVSKHVIVQYIEREKTPKEGAADVEPTQPKMDTSPQAIYKMGANGADAAVFAPAAVLTPPKDAETLAAAMAASAGPDILASMGPNGFLEAAKQWFAAKAAGAQAQVAPGDQRMNATTAPTSDNTTAAGRHLLWETDFTRIDVLVTYTAQAASAFSGGVTALVNRLRLVVAETNKAYLDSRIPIGMNLVDIRQVSWAEPNVPDPANDALNAAGRNQIPSLWNWRNELGADMVAVWVSKGRDLCGVGYLLGGGDAFSSTQIGCFNTFTFAHELGHNMGCGHNADQPMGGFPGYAYGHRRCDLGSNNYRTIMSYVCRVNGQDVSTNRINLFSNPALSFNGVVNGDAGSAHCARRLTETRNTIASARPVAKPVEFGNLVSWLPGRRCLDAPTWDSGRQLVIHQCHGGGNQRLELLGDGSLRFPNTNKCVDVRGAGTSDGTVVQLWDCNGTPAQRWFIDGRGGLHPYAAPNKCLDVPGSRDANQQGLQIWDCNGTPAQQWSTSANSLPGVFNPINRALQSRLNNLCVDVFAWDYTNGRQLAMWSCNGQNNQRWVTDWFGTIRSTHNTNKCMDATANDNGGAVSIHDCHNGFNQRWFSDTLGRLRPYSSPNRCLDIRGADRNPGAVLQIWDCVDVPQQRWIVA